MRKILNLKMKVNILRSISRLLNELKGLINEQLK